MSDPIETKAATQSYRPQVPGTLVLAVISGPDRGLKVVLPPGVHGIGKAETCALVLSDPAVSRQHLEIEVSQAGVRVRDLGSRNGSFFAGARFSEVTVGMGAVIAIGDSDLKLTSAETADLEQPASRATHFGRMVGASLPMRRVYALLERVAATDASVLIEGETGTGKEVCAEALHAASRRARKPLVICDLASVTRSLIESELFGHVRGAFTGADRDQRGLFEEAEGGTLFLDEIGELELALQPRLLRTIAQRKIRRLGTSTYQDVDVRVIAATNRNLKEEIAAGRFREDLYHRLAVITVSLPPLRERKEDLPQLVSALLEGEDEVEVAPETLALLAEYDWPGNVRELGNVLDRARSLAPVKGSGRVIDPALLGISPVSGSAVGTALADLAGGGGEQYRAAKERLIQTWERQFVTQLLRRCDGNITRAAREGGIDRGYLHRLIRKLGLSTEKP